MSQKLLLLAAEATDSALFARMLLLSLSTQGYEVIPLLPAASVTQEPNAALCILDADVLSPVARAAWAQARPCLFYTVDPSLAEGQIEGAPVLLRPFLMPQFSATVASMAGKEPAAPVAAPAAAPEEPQSHLPSDELAFGEAGVTFRGVLLSLTAREHELLSYLYAHRGTVRSRAQILADVWHYPPTDTKTNVADVYVRYLRAKIDQVFDVRLICAVRNGGYTMR